MPRKVSEIMAFKGMQAMMLRTSEAQFVMDTGTSRSRDAVGVTQGLTVDQIYRQYVREL